MIKKSRLSEKEQINLIYDNSFNIKDILNPSKNIMTYALRLNGMSILYIDQDKVTDDMQLIAYRSNKACLQAMKNPCYIVQIAAIQDMDRPHCFILPISLKRFNYLLLKDLNILEMLINQQLMNYLDM